MPDNRMGVAGYPDVVLRSAAGILMRKTKRKLSPHAEEVRKDRLEA
jgi:hypothetical protein